MKHRGLKCHKDQIHFPNPEHSFQLTPFSISSGIKLEIHSSKRKGYFCWSRGIAEGKKAEQTQNCTCNLIFQPAGHSSEARAARRSRSQGNSCCWVQFGHISGVSGSVWGTQGLPGPQGNGHSLQHWGFGAVQRKLSLCGSQHLSTGNQTTAGEGTGPSLQLHLREPA